MSPVDYDRARQLLEEAFSEAERLVLSRSPFDPLEDPIRNACEVVFGSKTQAYREALLGCILARIIDQSVDVRFPYTGLATNAFNGRDLDEKVINPFLNSRAVPCSRGPYLSVFRRSVRFDESTRRGLRDKAGYDAFLVLIEHINGCDENHLLSVLRYFAYQFVKLREEANIEVRRLHRVSLEQIARLVNGLISERSGGVYPLLLVVGTFLTLKEWTNAQWNINWQGINVADMPSGASGDITITLDDRILMVVEVTEREIDEARVVATFNTKIAPVGIEDYLFIGPTEFISDGVKERVRRYFSQGHEIAFAQITDWIVMLMATMGTRGRTLFVERLADLLRQRDVPSVLKVRWNDLIEDLVSS